MSNIEKVYDAIKNYDTSNRKPDSDHIIAETKLSEDEVIQALRQLDSDNRITFEDSLTSTARETHGQLIEFYGLSVIE